MITFLLSIFQCAIIALIEHLTWSVLQGSFLRNSVYFRLVNLSVCQSSVVLVQIDASCCGTVRMENLLAKSPKAPFALMQMLFLTTQAFPHVPQTQHISLPSRKTVMMIISPLKQSNQTQSNHTWTHPLFWRTREQRVSKKLWSFQSWTSKLISGFIWSSTVSLSLSLALNPDAYCLYVWWLLILQGFCVYHRLRNNSWLSTSRSLRAKHNLESVVVSLREPQMLAGRTCPCPIYFVIICYPYTIIRNHVLTFSYLGIPFSCLGKPKVVLDSTRKIIAQWALFRVGLLTVPWKAIQI